MRRQSQTKGVNFASLRENESSSPGGTSRPRGRAESSARATHAHGWSLRSSTECSRRGSVESSANAPGGTGGVVATARASRGNKARRAGDISASRAIMFKRLFGAEKSGGGSAPSAGSTGGGGGGKTTPLGAVEQLKDVRHPRSHLPRVSFFFGNPPRTRAVAFRLAAFLSVKRRAAFFSPGLSAFRSRPPPRVSKRHERPRP